MSELRYTDPRTGEVIDDPEVRPFREVLAELGEGATESELSEALWLGDPTGTRDRTNDGR